MKTQVHTIRELPTGWLHKEWGRTYKTLKGAVRAINGHESKIIRGGGSSAVQSVRNYEPTTEAGYRFITAFLGTGNFNPITED